MSASADFTLDARLAADTHAVGRTALCEVRLMDDDRWPWLLLIPRRADVTEWIDLAPEDARALLADSLAVAAAMKATAPTHKLNVAALGNVVAQFHLHHVLRHRGDAAWPGPVWGFGERRPLDAAHAATAVRDWRERLGSILVP